MTVIYEGFEDVRTETALGQVYDNLVFASDAQFVTGRFAGSTALDCGSGAGSSFQTTVQTAASEWTVGVAVFIRNPEDDTKLIDFLDGQNSQCFLNVRADGDDFYLEVKRGSTVLETSSTFSYGWHYIEMYVDIHTSTGDYEVWLNENSIMSDTGVNTAAAGGTDVTRVQMGGADDGSSGTDKFLIDDIYIRDDTTNHGDIRIDAIFPEADGATNDWSAVGELDNYANVDETDEPNDDTDYVTSSTNNDRELYDYQDAPSSLGTILAVVLRTWARQEAAGSQNFRPVLRHSDGSTINVGTTVAIDSTAYGAPIEEVFATNPATASAWLLSELNDPDTQFGFEIIA